MVLAKDKKKNKDFDSIAVSIASPEQVLVWSHGEVTKPETINYRTQKPERDGLFCERIFGPTRNWECYCGKYKKIIYKGVVCEKCGVEVTRSSVRRERMGHIELAVPIAHIWFLRSTPSRVGLLLDIPIKGLEQVVYFAAYIIKTVDQDAKKAALDQLQGEYENYVKRIKEEVKSRRGALKSQIQDEKKLDEKVLELENHGVEQLDELNESFHRAKEELKSIQLYRVIPEIEYRELSMKFGHVFSAGIGAEALREIISQIDLKKFIDERVEELKVATEIKQKKIFKRIKLAMSLLRNHVRPEWMIMTQLPVLPPDLRPMVQLDGGRYAASDLNDLYRRVINRNNRLKKLLRLGAPEVISRNEKRMLQEAVDTLLNNSGRSGKAAFTTSDKRKLRSLSDMLKGKQGRFRQNLLGKRVDYSGRSVIVVGPKLRLHQCGIPKEMAMKLFKPFVLGRLIEDGMAHNVKNAERVVSTGRKEVWDILEEVTKNHYVLLNRAPTLHRLSIQAFQPVLIDGKAIQIHPLVCTAFNADFDGDQMAVHVPLSDHAQKEAREIMRSSANLLKPSAGEPITAASQDMVMGCYFLTKMFAGKQGEGKFYADFESARLDYEMGGVDLHAKIKVRCSGAFLETSVGRIIFNEEVVIPAGLPYKNQDFGNSDLKKLLTECFNEKGIDVTAQMSDALKDLGFKYATKSGLTISVNDLIVPDEKKRIIDEASAQVKKINDAFWKGWITAEERYNHNIRIWAQAKSDIMNALIARFSQEHEHDLFYQIESGARGNWGHITQLCGMKGLVANPSGKTIELPIISNLKEGFSVIEYFISTHGGRKGKSDTALKTAEAGYLTRRLVDAVQDIIIREADCGHNFPLLITRQESEAMGVSYESRLLGRTISENIMVGKKEVLFKEGVVMGVKHLQAITSAGVDSVQVRSIMTCSTQNGICQACYGMDLSNAQGVELGTAVGIIAAQSIGEPGTQLTMRTFHMGGVAEGGDITQGLPRVEELFEARPPKHPAVLADLSGKIMLRRTKSSIEVTIKEEERGKDVYMVRHGFKVEVKPKDAVREKQIIIRGTEDKTTVRAKFSGIVQSVSAGEVVVEHADLKEITYKLPVRASLLVSNGDEVELGTAITTGHYDLREFVEKKGIEATQFYIMREVQRIYASQGQLINNKHIEIIVKQMFSKVRIIDPGDTDFLHGEIVDLMQYRKVNQEMKKAKRGAFGERILLGLTRIALHTDSWLSAASFQETIRVLVDAAVTKRVDALTGLKENVIIGRLINAGKVFQKRLNGEDPFGEEDVEDVRRKERDVE